MRLTNEGLADGIGDGGGEEEDGHDEGLHVLWRLRESVFETSNRRHNLRDSDQDV